MLFVKIILGLLISFIIYKEVIKGAKTPTFNLIPIINIIVLLVVIFFLMPIFFPEFFGKLFGENLMILILLIGALIYTGHMFLRYRYNRYSLSFILLLILTIWKYSGNDVSFSSFGKKVAKKEAYFIAVAIDGEGKETIIYDGPTPYNISESLKVKIIPNTCGMTISAYSPGWAHPVDLRRDCSGIWEEVPLPARSSPIIRVRSTN